MERSESLLRRRAARAYERGRAVAALRQVAPLALLLVGVPLVTGSGWAPVGGLVAALGAAALWRGGVVGRAARAGLLAGLAPLIAPIAVSAIGHRCTGCGPVGNLPLCIAMCVGGGMFAGAVLGFLASRESRRVPFAAVAIGLAALTGALGCVFAGAAGLLGLAVGLALGGVAPLLVAARGR